MLATAGKLTKTQTTDTDNGNQIANDETPTTDNNVVLHILCTGDPYYVGTLYGAVDFLNVLKK